MRRPTPSSSTQIALFPPPAEAELPVELPAPQQQELIRAVAELLLRAVATARPPAPRGGHDHDR